MARQKTLPGSVRAKLALAERLADLRSELYGERGGPELARRLGVPIRCWYNYEEGVTVPAEIVLKIIKLTSVEAEWLLDGKGPKFRLVRAEPGETTSPHETAVGTLLRTALHLLENSESTRPILEGASAASDSADGTPTAIGVSPPSQNVTTARHGPWSERLASHLGSSARPDRREA
jgi:hypothetical protein